MAVVYVLGVCVSAGECGLFLRAAAGVLLAGIFLFGIQKKKLYRSAAALLFVLAFTGLLRYQLAQRAFQASEERIRIFDGLSVRLDGELLQYTEAGGQARFLIRNARLSSAYGSRESLPDTATDAMRARYDQPVGTILVYMDAGEERPLPGEILAVYGKISPAEAPRNEGVFDFGLYNRSISVHGSMYGSSFSVTGGTPKPFARGLQELRLRMGDVLDRLLPVQDAGIYRAMLTGDKSAMDTEIRTLYQDNGIAHILAVSGLHLSVLGMGAYQLLRRLGRSKACAGLLAACVIISYGILTGSSGSALRAVIMLLIRFLGAAAGRSYDMLSAMAAAALLLLVQQPYMLFSSGFQLSFLAILSLGLCSEMPSPKHPLIKTLWTSGYLQLLTLPVILYHYFRFPLYGIFLNLIVLPLMSYVIYSGLLGIVFFPFSELLAAVAVGGGHYILSIYTLLCTKCAALPYSSLLLGRPGMPQIVLYYTALFLFTYGRIQDRKPRPGKRVLPLPAAVAFLVLSLLFLPPRVPDRLEITALDVGQGDGFVLRNEGLVMTVDIGSTSDKSLGKNVLVPYLESQSIAHIDAALITHADQDHYSGLLYLLEEEPQISVGELVLSRAAEQDTRYDKLREAAAAADVPVRYIGSGDGIALGDAELHAYYPVGNARIEEVNDHSVGMLLQYHDFRMLFTGDMDQDCEHIMLSEMQKELKMLPKIDILKAGHHGSHTSTSEELLAALKPDYALLSYGEDNDYGHPHTETLEALARHQVRLLQTGTQGRIRIRVR